ncbi:hypothetical protein [Parahaliea mediterranea]|uniref:hypothetical protein n=1 Tax=Parahaliea mediterranea TaxID=651086 RepID=UPI000E2E46D6|nr:hypothetical protein [Parahaliea mediterranea]
MMLTLLLFVAACLLSSLGFAWLAAVNPKRRRVYGLARPAAPAPWQKLAMALLVLAPGVLLLLCGQVAGFVLWLGAITVIGWVVALRRPPLTA